MMPSSTDSQPLDAGDWFPWRMFVEAAGAACSPATLLLSVAGLLVAELGVAAIGGLADGESATSLTLPSSVGVTSLDPQAMLVGASDGLCGYQAGFVRPLTPPDASLVGGLAVLWRVAVWSLAGAAIARVAAMRLTRHEDAGLDDAFRWSWRTVAPRIGLIACLVAAFGAACWVVSLLGAASEMALVGGAVSFALPLVLLIAALGAIVGLGAAIGWPLMTVSAGVERPDPFDSLSRGLAYAYQRPLRLLVYVAQAWVVGVATGVAVQLLVRTGLRIATLWLEGRGASGEGLPTVAAFIWAEATRLPMIYHAAYYWCAATAIYLLLRRDIDEQQADEVFVES